MVCAAWSGILPYVSSKERYGRLDARHTAAPESIF